MMVNCPRCQNRPNECYRSRWFKQVFLPALRFRWRCMRCGTTFTAWMWSASPNNSPFINQTKPRDTDRQVIEIDHEVEAEAIAPVEELEPATAQ